MTLLTTVLLSGGLDSAALLGFHAARGDTVSALHVTYGQPAANSEREAADRIARHYDVALKCIEIRGVAVELPGEIPGRNAILLLAAYMNDPHGALISIGIHAGSTYSDCSTAFVGAVQSILDIYSGGGVRAIAPFVDWHKSEILAFAQHAAVPIDLTYSCDAQDGLPCGLCPSCKDRVELGC